MKTALLACLASLGVIVHAADDAKSFFQFLTADELNAGDAGGKKVQVPYNTSLGAQDDCIMHDKPVSDVHIFTTNQQSIDDDYCVYLFKTDEACGGCVDEMLDVLAGSSSDYEHFEQPGIATVVRQGSCPESKPCPLEAA